MLQTSIDKRKRISGCVLNMKDFSPARWAPTRYKYGYNSTYRGYNPCYPFVKPLIGVLGSMKKLVRDHLGTIAKWKASNWEPAHLQLRTFFFAGEHWSVRWWSRLIASPGKHQKFDRRFRCTPSKTKLAMENSPFEDVFPILKTGMLHCYVSLPAGTSITIPWDLIILWVDDRGVQSPRQSI